MREYDYEQSLNAALEERIAWLMKNDGMTRADAVRSVYDDYNGIIFELADGCTPFYTYDIWTLCGDSYAVREAISEGLADGMFRLDGGLDSVLMGGICLYGEQYLRDRVQWLYDELDEED